MRLLPTLFAIVPLVAIPAALHAAGPADSPGAGDDKVLCRYLTHTGTRFKTKHCRTVAQWDALTEKSRRNASEMIDRPFIYDCRRQGGC